MNADRNVASGLGAIVTGASRGIGAAVAERLAPLLAGPDDGWINSQVIRPERRNGVKGASFRLTSCPALPA